MPPGSFIMGGVPASAAWLRYTDPAHEVWVDSFALDTFEVTFARFQKFVDAYEGPPSEGAGAHPKISGSGWQPAWNSFLPATKEEFSTVLEGGSLNYGVEAGDEGKVAMYGMNWYEAFAFCAWDGGRLPTEAEWEMAAAGGEENRRYPWGDEDVTEDKAEPPFMCNWHSPGYTFWLVPVGSHPLGAGRWGHEDLVGSVPELVLDAYSDTFFSQHAAPLSCSNCANTEDSKQRVRKGGRHPCFDLFLERTGREPFDADVGATWSPYPELAGFRCARDLKAQLPPP